MKKNLNWLFALVLVTSTLVLAGCSQGAQTPTMDPVAIYTQVAQTVQAQVTNNAKLTPKPTSTPLPVDTLAATSTLRPSSTPFGTLQATANTSLTPAKTGTAATLPPAKTVTGATLPAAATATLAVVGTQSAPTSGDKMLYVSQAVADGTTFGALEGFTQKWVIKNVGTTTWDNTYLVRLYAGPNLGGNDGPLAQTVKPNGQITISMDMRAPDKQGEYTSVWVLTAPDGHNFGSFTLTIKVK
jgi:hypothetical protein